MELFENITGVASSRRSLEIVTPLGRVTSSTTVDAQELTSENSTRFYLLNADSFAARWEIDAGIAEVIVSRPRLVDEFRTRITDCWAFLWRFKVLKPISKLVFSSSWRPDYAWATCDGAESGEWLESQAWHDGKTKVSFGTTDSDVLFFRSKASDWMPPRYAQQPNNDYFYPNLVHYLDDGLETNFGEAFPNECFQTHFAVAWAPYKEDSVDTWLAVDVRAKNILEGAHNKNE